MKIKLIIGLIVFCVMVTGYFYIQALQGKLEAAAEVQQRLESVIDQQQKVLDRNAEDLRKMQQINKELSESFTDSQSKLSDLNAKFNKYNLAEKAAANPTDAENRVNRGTVDALRCNELVTGARLTADEKSGKVTNSICGELVKRLIAKEPKDAK
jgi:ABC-type transporter Mla subunit MlaD